MWQGFKFPRRRHIGVEFVVGPFLCSEKFFSGYSGIPLSLETYISKFQIDMARMDTFKRFFKELLMETFARPALRPKRSSARELNPTRECSQALKGCCLLHAAKPLPLVVVFVLSRNGPSQKERCVTRQGRLGH